jgi:hypothetical protein
MYYWICDFKKAIEIYDKYGEEIYYFSASEEFGGGPDARPWFFRNQIKDMPWVIQIGPRGKERELLKKPESEWPDWLRERVEECRKMGAIDW